MKIFISSTYVDLIEYRPAVRDVILKLGHHPIAMEDFGAGPTAPQSAALGKIKDCDALVGVYACPSVPIMGETTRPVNLV